MPRMDTRTRARSTTRISVTASPAHFHAAPSDQWRLKYCTSRSCFSAAERLLKVPRLALARARIELARIETIASGFQLADHAGPPLLIVECEHGRAGSTLFRFATRQPGVPRKKSLICKSRDQCPRRPCESTDR